MFKRWSKHRNFILLAALILLPFACVNGGNYSRNLGSYSRNAPGLNPYIHSPQAYQPYTRPSSRDYANPYMDPPNNYYPYYDFDQNYVPPNEYKNIEKGNDDPSLNKF